MSIVSRQQGKHGTLKLPLPDTCIHKHIKTEGQQDCGKRRKKKFRSDRVCSEIIFFGERQNNHVIQDVPWQPHLKVESMLRRLLLPTLGYGRTGHFPEEMREKNSPWADALIPVSVKWSKRLHSGREVESGGPHVLFCRGRGKECLQGFMWGYSHGPEKGVRHRPGVEQMSQRHIFGRSPLSSPIFWRSRAGPISAFFFSTTSIGMKGAGTGLLSLSLCQIERESELDISFISLVWFETCVDEECNRLGCNRNSGQQMTVFMALTHLPTTAISIRWGPGTVCLSFSISCFYLTLRSPKHSMKSQSHVVSYRGLRGLRPCVTSLWGVSELLFGIFLSIGDCV